MRRLLRVLRTLLGIRPYSWRPTPPPPTGARGINGTQHHPEIYWYTSGLTPKDCRMLYELECSRQAIHQLVVKIDHQRARFEHPQPADEDGSYAG